MGSWQLQTWKLQAICWPPLSSRLRHGTCTQCLPQDGSPIEIGNENMVYHILFIFCYKMSVKFLNCFSFNWISKCILSNLWLIIWKVLFEVLWKGEVIVCPKKGGKYSFSNEVNSKNVTTSNYKYLQIITIENIYIYAYMLLRML